MSWSLQFAGTKAEVTDYLDNVAPGVIGHVTGDERALADQTLGLLRAAVAVENSPVDFTVSINAYGSASFDPQGNQLLQSVSMTVSAQLKPTP